jgi:hypothetical protein
MKALEDTNTRLKREVTELHRKLGEVDAKANETEQYSRLNNLRFYGIIEKETEDCYDEFVKFCDRELGLARWECIDISAQRLNNDLPCNNEWTRDWNVTINPGKTKSVTFSSKM